MRISFLNNYIGGKFRKLVLIFMDKTNPFIQ